MRVLLDEQLPRHLREIGGPLDSTAVAVTRVVRKVKELARPFLIPMAEGEGSGQTRKETIGSQKSHLKPKAKTVTVEADIGERKKQGRQ